MGVGQELPTDLRQRHGTGGTVKQLGAKFVLQTFDLPGNGRLGHGQLLGGLGVIERAGQGRKTFQLMRVHKLTSQNIFSVGNLFASHFVRRCSVIIPYGKPGRNEHIRAKLFACSIVPPRMDINKAKETSTLIGSFIDTFAVSIMIYRHFTNDKFLDNITASTEIVPKIRDAIFTPPTHNVGRRFEGYGFINDDEGASLHSQIR